MLGISPRKIQYRLKAYAEEKQSPGREDAAEEDGSEPAPRVPGT